MAGNLGVGTIELIADARKFRAGIEEAKKSLKDLGDSQRDVSARASASIDRYVQSLQTQAATLGKSTRDTELYKLAARGASDAQLESARSALRLVEAHEKGVAIGEKLRQGFIFFGTVAVASLAAAAVAFTSLVERAANFQDMAEKVGDSAAALSSLSVAAAVGGVSMDNVANIAIKLSKNLTGVDDESKSTGAAVAALGLNLEALKQQAPVERLEAIAKAFSAFDDVGKDAVAIALFGKAGAEALPFMKELAEQTQRQNGLTSEQIKIADDYSDANKRATAQLLLHAEALAVSLLPQIIQFKRELVDLAKELKGSGDATEVLKTTLSGAVFVFKNIASVVLGLAGGFTLLGISISSVARASAALASFDGKGAGIISDQGKKDLSDTLATYAKLIEGMQALGGTGAGKRTIPGFDFSDVTNTSPRPRLNFQGAVKDPKAGGKDTSINAQLAADLDAIKRAGALNVDTFQNSDRILQAERAASLIQDAQYYSVHSGFLNNIARVQQEALEKEIARIQTEKAVGKDKIDNDKKINELTAQGAKIRADLFTNQKINDIQAANAVRLLEQAYIDATTASDAYLESVKRRNASELGGVGRGTRERDLQGGRDAIEDKFTTQRQTLERDLRNKQITQATFDAYLDVASRTYDEEIKLYEKRTKAITAAEGNWINGANEAINNYISNARNIAKQTEDLFVNAFRSMEDALVEFAKTGKLDFKKLADSIISDLIRIQTRAALASAAKGFQESGGFGGLIAGIFGKGGGANASADAYIDFSGAAGSITPVYEQGTDYVPRTGLAMIHKGEAVLTASENAVRKGGDTYNVDMRGASIEAVERLERFVASVNGSIESRSLAAYKQARVRGAV